MSGPDQQLSLEPNELTDLVKGCKAVKQALGNTKKILKNEKPILKFARESVVSIKHIKKGETYTESNIGTKRPNTGKIPAKNYYNIIGKKAKCDILPNKQLSLSDVS